MWACNFFQHKWFVNAREMVCFFCFKFYMFTKLVAVCRNNYFIRKLLAFCLPFIGLTGNFTDGDSNVPMIVILYLLYSGPSRCPFSIHSKRQSLFHDYNWYYFSKISWYCYKENMKSLTSQLSYESIQNRTLF